MLAKISKSSISRKQVQNFSTILDIKAREILDSRGFPTVEADVIILFYRFLILTHPF